MPGKWCHMIIWRQWLVGECGLTNAFNKKAKRSTPSSPHYLRYRSTASMEHLLCWLSPTPRGAPKQSIVSASAVQKRPNTQAYGPRLRRGPGSPIPLMWQRTTSQWSALPCKGSYIPAMYMPNEDTTNQCMQDNEGSQRGEPWGCKLWVWKQCLYIRASGTGNDSWHNWRILCVVFHMDTGAEVSKYGNGSRGDRQSSTLTCRTDIKRTQQQYPTRERNVFHNDQLRQPTIYNGAGNMIQMYQRSDSKPNHTDPV